MTHPSIRRLRRPSSLKPTGREATPELRQTHRLWTRLSGRYARWVESRKSGAPPIDPRWIESFDFFYESVGKRPKGCSLAPVDPKAPLGPDNFQWRPWREISRYALKQRQMTLTLDGEKRSIADWSEHLGIPESTIRYRVNVGMPPERVLAKTSYRATA